MNHKKGFTLVELAVVVIIIAVLTAIGIISYQGSQAKARDAKRKSDANSIASALELYKADNKRYPILHPTNPTRAGCLTKGCTLAAGAPGYTDEQNWRAFQTAMANYLSPLPTDPTAGVVVGGGITSPMGYYVFDFDNTSTPRAACSTRGACYTIYIGPTETDQSDGQNCTINGAFRADVPAGRYICLRN